MSQQHKQQIRKAAKAKRRQARLEVRERYFVKKAKAVIRDLGVMKKFYSELEEENKILMERLEKSREESNATVSPDQAGNSSANQGDDNA